MSCIVGQLIWDILYGWICLYKGIYMLIVWLGNQVLFYMVGRFIWNNLYGWIGLDTEFLYPLCFGNWVYPVWLDNLFEISCMFGYACIMYVYITIYQGLILYGWTIIWQIL